MAGTVGQFQQSAFTTPVNGDPLNASVPLSNDNAVRGKHNSHDADPTIHIQSSDLATRPAFGSAQRVWWTTDEQRIYFDSGLAWLPLKVRAEDVLAGTISGDLTIGDDLVVTDDASIGGDLTVTGTLTLGALSLTGDLAVGDDLTVTGDSAMAGAVVITRSTYTIGDYFVAKDANSEVYLGLSSQGIGSIRVVDAGAETNFDIYVNDSLGAATRAFLLDPTGTLSQTWMSIYINGLGFKRVSVGDLDSGGTGLRALVVPNV